MESRQVFAFHLKIFNLKNFGQSQTNFSHLWKCPARPTTATTNGRSGKQWFRQPRSVFFSSTSLSLLASTFGCLIMGLISFLFKPNIFLISASNQKLGFHCIDIRMSSIVLFRQMEVTLFQVILIAERGEAELGFAAIDSLTFKDLSEEPCATFPPQVTNNKTTKQTKHRQSHF